MPVFRLADEGDVDAIAALVNDDHVLGQPRCRAENVRKALAGAATMERAWWDNFVDLQTIVATDGNSVLGAASSAVHREEGTAYVLWLHARESLPVVADLLDEVVRMRESQTVVRAFWIATPLSLGMEGLPAQHRAVTHAALLRRGFSGRDEWLYLVGDPVSEAADVADVHAAAENEWTLTISDTAGATIGEAKAELGQDGVGIVWWLEVKPQYRGRSYGRALLLQAMKLLGAAGAERLILYVDHADPSSRDRRPAIQLYESVGFRTVDHLWSYELSGDVAERLR